VQQPVPATLRLPSLPSLRLRPGARSGWRGGRSAGRRWWVGSEKGLHAFVAMWLALASDWCARRIK